MRLKKPYIALVFFTFITVNSASAHATACNVIINTTGGVIGGIIGMAVDIVTFGGSGGLGTVFGSGAGTGTGKAISDSVCPDETAHMVEETSLVGVLDTCISNSYEPYNPLWNKVDFCRVPGTPFFAPGGDVSVMDGRQLDHDVVIGRLAGIMQIVGANLKKAGKINQNAYQTFWDTAKNLSECQQTYYSGWTDDYCDVMPTERTARFFGTRAGRTSEITAYDAIIAARSAVIYLARDFQITG